MPSRTLPNDWQRVGSKSVKIMDANTALMQVGSKADPQPKATGKTRLMTLVHLDGRTIAARRATALAKMFAAELGEVTPALRIRVETAAALTAIAEDCQTRRLAGDPAITLDDLVRAVSAARRAVRDLGIKGKSAVTVQETFADIAARAQAEASKRRALELAEDEREAAAISVAADEELATSGHAGGADAVFPEALAKSVEDHR